MSYQLKDEVWYKTIQIVQLAMLTGTDVADYLRQIRVVEAGPNELGLDPEYEKLFEKTVDQLMERLVELQAQAEGHGQAGEAFGVFGALDPALKG